MSTDIESLFSRHAEGEASSPTVDHVAWDRLVRTHVRPDGDGLNKVDYMGFEPRGRAELERYLADLQRVDVPALDRSEQFAYWVNLYNALIVKVVLDHFPVKSIRDISLGGALLATVMGGPWKAKIATVNGLALSFDDIEHTILRRIFKDPRLHFAINCGSVGCPNLRTEAFTAAAIESQLEASAREFVNSRRGVAIENGRLVLSAIFKWYKRDFGGDERNVLDHLKRYADEPLRGALETVITVDRYDYDWRLNDQKT